MIKVLVGCLPLYFGSSERVWAYDLTMLVLAGFDGWDGYGRGV